MREIGNIIDERPSGPLGRGAQWLRERRVFLGAGLALVELIWFLGSRPGVLAMSVFALVLLVLAVAAMGRVGTGPLRDILMVVAIAQGLILILPLTIGLGVALGAIAGIAILALIVAAAFRLRV